MHRGRLFSNGAAFSVAACHKGPELPGNYLSAHFCRGVSPLGSDGWRTPAPSPLSVAAAMDDFVNVVNRSWESNDPVFLATYVLWRLNNIHPFINGNGRTARAACYYVLCLKLGGWPDGTVILPELIKRDRDEYCVALQAAHDAFAHTGEPDLKHLHEIVSRLLNEQLASAAPATEPVA
nr:Fic family protein [Mesorhizobium sp.]